MNFEIDSVMWKSRFPNAKVDAGDAYREIEKVRSKKGGNFTDDDIVDAAKSARNKLHVLFEWDDTVAALEHRRSTARAITRALVVEYKASDQQEQTRAYEVVVKSPLNKREGERRTLYSSFEEAVSDRDSREYLLGEAIRQLMQLRKRFRVLNELDRVFEAIDAVVDGAQGQD